MTILNYTNRLIYESFAPNIKVLTNTGQKEERIKEWVENLYDTYPIPN